MEDSKIIFSIEADKVENIQSVCVIGGFTELWDLLHEAAEGNTQIVELFTAVTLGLFLRNPDELLPWFVDRLRSAAAAWRGKENMPAFGSELVAEIQKQFKL